MAENEEKKKEEEQNYSTVPQFSTTNYSTTYFDTGNFNNMSSNNTNLNVSYNQFQSNSSYTPINVQTSAPQTTPVNIKTSAPQTSAPVSSQSKNYTENKISKSSEENVCVTPIDVKPTTPKVKEGGTSKVEVKSEATPANVKDGGYSEIKIKSTDEELFDYNEITNMSLFGRKEDGNKGFLYRIRWVAEHPESIPLEGRILYEEFLDDKKYEKEITSAYDNLEKYKKTVEEKSDALEEETGYKSSESKVFSGEEAKQYQEKILETEENFNRIYQKVKELYDDLPNDIALFKKFNKTLLALKQATLLQMAVDTANKFNGTKIAGPFSTCEIRKESGYGTINTKWNMTKIYEEKTKYPDASYIQVKETKVNNNTFDNEIKDFRNARTYEVNVTRTTYVRIDIDGILDKYGIKKVGYKSKYELGITAGDADSMTDDVRNIDAETYDSKFTKARKEIEDKLNKIDKKNYVAYKKNNNIVRRLK